MTQQEINTLVFSYEFFPGADFRVDAPLETSTTIDILNGPTDQGVPEISQPDEYNGYVISYRLGQSSLYTYAFTRDSTLQQDRNYTFGQGSQVFSSELNLLQAQASRRGGQDQQTETPSPSPTPTPTDTG